MKFYNTKTIESNSHSCGAYIISVYFNLHEKYCTGCKPFSSSYMRTAYYENS